MVELLVVGAIITLLLGIGVPAFNALSRESRLSKGRQLITSTLRRANIAAITNRGMTAVRFMPVEWALSDNPSPTARRHQALVTYRYELEVQAPGNPVNIAYDDAFAQLEGASPVVLPTDVWAAPSNALVSGAVGDRVLTGDIGAFELDAGASGSKLLEADDFLIVFDHERGLASRAVGTAWRMRAYDPTINQTVGGSGWRGNTQSYNVRYQRFNYTGIVMYQREPFRSLGNSATARARRDLLKRTGAAMYVHRTNGSLVNGETTSGED